MVLQIALEDGPMASEDTGMQSKTPQGPAVVALLQVQIPLGSQEQRELGHQHCQLTRMPSATRAEEQQGILLGLEAGKTV